MPEIKPYISPWEAAQALVAEHAQLKFGIPDADPLKLVTEIAFSDSELLDPEVRLAAAKVLLKYTRPEVRAIQMEVNGNVSVEHTHRAEEAVQKARSLLTMLGVQKYRSGEIQEGELLPAPPPQPAEDPVKH